MPKTRPMTYSILLVDDEASLRYVLQLSLVDSGYDVTTAANAKEALHLFRNIRPQIVLTDIKMPGMIGTELLRIIKAEQPDTEVIMITGHGDMTLAIECLKHDATDFITKPIQPDTLEIALKRARERIEMRRQIAVYTEQRIKAGEYNYQQLFNTAPCYITVQDPSLTIVAANRRFEDDFDYLSGTRCYQAYKQRTQPCKDCPVVKTFADGQSYQGEMLVTSKNGAHHNLLITTAPIQNAAGEIVQVMELSTNITEMRALEDHLAAIGLKIGTISHSIKGLLTGLDSGMYLLDAGFKKQHQAKLKEGFDIIQLMVGRIRSLVLEILYIAKERDLKWEHVEIKKFTQDVVTHFENKLKQLNIELVVEIDPTVQHFEVDPSVVRAALVNIFENAVDACQEEATLKAKKIVCKVTQEPADIVFQIIDNGIGMDADTQAKLFRLFYSSKGHKGTGLGLYMADLIIKNHGGTIAVESQPGRGSHFTVKLPKVAINKTPSDR